MPLPARYLPEATRSGGVRVRRRSLVVPSAVLEFESPSAAIVAQSVPPLSRATNLFVFLLVAALIVASALIRIDKIVSVKGKLVADVPNIVIQPFDQTIVESIEVKQGAIVHKGQVLARLNATFTAADHALTKDQVDMLDAKVARLQAEADGVTYTPNSSDSHALLQASIFGQRAKEYQFSLQAFDKRSEQLRTQIAGAKSQAAYFRERLGIAANIEGIYTKLAGMQSDSKYNRLLATDGRLQVAASLSGAESSAAEAERTLGAGDAERKTFIERWKGQVSADLADARGKLVEAQQLYAKTDLHNRLVVLTAPRDAVVLSVAKISVGSVVTSAEPIMQLVPLDAPLSAEVDIPGVDSGYVATGNEARIKFDTLPFLQYGTARGVVRSLSADSFSPETRPDEGGSSLPSRPSMLYYRAAISMGQLMLHDTPVGFRPMPGMPITADVKVGMRSVLGYFTDRILPIAHEGLREP